VVTDDKKCRQFFDKENRVNDTNPSDANVLPPLTGGSCRTPLILWRWTL